MPSSGFFGRLPTATVAQSVEADAESLWQPLRMRAEAMKLLAVGRLAMIEVKGKNRNEAADLMSGPEAKSKEEIAGIKEMTLVCEGEVRASHSLPQCDQIS